MGAEQVGALLIRLLWDDSDFASGSAASQKEYERVASGFGAISVAAGDLIADAFKAALSSVQEFVAGVVETGSAFQAQIDLVGALGGATGQQLQQIQDEARKLGRETVFSATDAAEAMTVLAQAGKSVDESITLAGTSLQFAQAQGVKLEAATELLVTTTNAYKLQNLQAADASDILTEAANKSQLNFERLSNALRYAAPSAATFGISLQETTAALAAFADVGFRGTQSGTTFRHALAEVAAPGKKATETLDGLGIKLQEVNPKVVGFTGLIERLAKSQFDASAAIKIFGSETGPAIAALVDATRAGTVNLREFQAGLAGATGATARQVVKVSDNVATRLKLLQSNFQDISLSIFDGLAEPIKKAIDAVLPFLGQLSTAVEAVSTRVEQGLLQAVDHLSRALKNQGRSGADFLAGALVTIVDVTSALINVTATLIEQFGQIVQFAQETGLAQYADDLAVLVTLLGTITGGISGLVTVLGAGSGAAAGFEVAIAALGGPVGVIIALIATLTIGMTEYEKAVEDAEAATEAFQAAQRGVQADSDNLFDKLTGGQSISDIRASTAEFVKSFETAEASGQEFSAQLKEQATKLADLQNLSDQQIRLKIESGDLVVAGGRLATVESLVSEMDASGFDTITERVKTFRGEAGRLTKEIDRVSGELAKVREQNSASGSDQFDIFLPDFDPKTATKGTQEAVEEYLKLQGERRDGAIKAAEEIERQQRASSARVLKEEKEKEEGRTAAVEDGGAARTKAEEKEAKEQARIAKHAADELDRLADQASAAAAKQVLGPAEQVQRQLQLSIADVQAALGTYLKATTDSEEDRAARIAQADETIANLRTAATEKLKDIEDKASAARLKSKEQLQGKITGLEERDANEAVKIRTKAAELLAEVDKSAQARREDLLDEYGAKIALAADPKERVDLEQQRADALVALDKETAATRLQISDTTEALIAKTIYDELDKAEAANRAAMAQAQENLKEAVDLFFAEPGYFDRSFAKLLGRVRETLATKFPEMTRFALDFAKAIGSAVGDVQSLGHAVTGLFSSLTGGALSGAFDPVGIVQGLIGNQDQAIQTVNDAQKTYDEARKSGDAEATKKAREDLIAAETDASTAQSKNAGAAMIDSMAEAATRFVQELAKQLPGIIDALVADIPVVVNAVLAAVPDIIGALVDGLPKIIKVLGKAIVKLVNALPAIITQIVKGLPKIIVALTSQIPKIIRAVVRNLPTIIYAILDGIPDIFAALIGHLPDIWFALVEGIYFELLPRLPKIAWEFIKAFILAIVKGAEALGKSLRRVIKAAIGVDFNPFKKKDNGDDKKKQPPPPPPPRKPSGTSVSAQQGIPFVARTTRLLVHQGERILTAGENRQASVPGGSTRNPLQPAAMLPRGGGASPQPLYVRVALGDRDLDSHYVQADARGGLPLTGKSSRRKTGTRVGYKRPGQR
jgi:TP901 family phage tail tape measure protein